MLPHPTPRPSTGPIRSLVRQTTSISKAGKPLARSESATTSISHAGQQASNRPTSSIVRAGQPTTNVTSIKRLQAVSHSVHDEAAPEGYGSAPQDESYYAYSRRLVKERLKREAEAQAKSTSTNSPFQISTGSQFRTKKLEKSVKKFFRTHKSISGSLSEEQKKAFTTMIGKQAKSSSTPGSGLTYQKVKQLQRDIYTKRKSLGLSTTQANRLKQLASKMKRTT